MFANSSKRMGNDVKDRLDLANMCYHSLQNLLNFRFRPS
jgi:hypothetical protein